MNSANIQKKDTLSILAAASRIGIRRTVLDYRISKGQIECVEGRLKKSDVERIASARHRFVGIKEIMRDSETERFLCKHADNRNKYIDFLEINDYFGVQTQDPSELLFTMPEDEEIYVKSEDVAYLKQRSEEFFRFFGYTEQEKATLVLDGIKSKTARLLIKKFAGMINADNIYTPSYTDFIRVLSEVDDIRYISDEDILTIIENVETKKTKSLLVDFFNYVARHYSVAYGEITKSKAESRSVPAYTYDEFVALAEILFSARYANDYNLIEKAINNHVYAEMWLFLSIHYICGWRASDICNNWVYPDIASSDNPYGITWEDVKDDILNNGIADSVLDQISNYIIDKISLSFNLPSKTATENAGKMRVAITPDLKAFFGRLSLICEYHHVMSGEGYMLSNRIARYCNWVLCKEFFGEPIYLLFGKNNIRSRRLNKSYLQAMEESARQLGASPFTAHMIASYARNHVNIKTTIAYLKDHALSGETAEVVLYMMMQRGVLSMYLYNALLAAYPDSFEKLNMQEQTRLMEMIPIAGYELEMASKSLLASYEIKKQFSNGNIEEPTKILRSMYAIGNGKGRAKDTGVYCKKRALGEVCVNPHYESCIANVCPHHVLTTNGIPSLIEVLRDYQRKAKADKEKGKYEAVLQKKIIPAFQEVINVIIKEMSRDERAGIRRIIKEASNE